MYNQIIPFQENLKNEACPEFDDEDNEDDVDDNYVQMMMMMRRRTVITMIAYKTFS